MKVYHLTKKSNLYGENGIANIGLIPQCGERSKSIGDNRKVISFTNSCYTLPVWWIYLYPKVDPSDLCVLTFDVPKSKVSNYNNKTEFATEYPILPSDISIAYFYDKETLKRIPFYHLKKDKMKNLGWGEKPNGSKHVEIAVLETPISEYVKINKKVR